MNDVEKVAAIMKKYREKRKMSGTELAKKLNMSRQSLNQYESGTRKIQVDLWIRWVNALDFKLRSVAETVEEELLGIKRSRLSKKEQELRKARALLRNEG
jgi:transcriptional regulator with XRE-family HTH domain